MWGADTVIQFLQKFSAPGADLKPLQTFKDEVRAVGTERGQGTRKSKNQDWCRLKTGDDGRQAYDAATIVVHGVFLFRLRD